MLPRHSALLLHFVSPPHYFRNLIKPRRRQQAIVHALFSLKARFFKCMVACVAKVFAISIKMKYASFFCCPFHPKPTFFLSISVVHVKLMIRNRCVWSGSNNSGLPRNNRCPLARFHQAGREMNYAMLSRRLAAGLFYFRELIFLLWLYFKCHPKVVEKGKSEYYKMNC